MFGNKGRNFVPVNQGDEIDVTIEAVGEKGDGVAKIKGFVLFVPDTKEGQRVKVRVNKVLKKVGFADVIGEATTEADADEQQNVVPPPDKEPEQQYEDSEDFGEEEAPAEETEAAEEEAPTEETEAAEEAEPTEETEAAEEEAPTEETEAAEEEAPAEEAEEEKKD